MSDEALCIYEPKEERLNVITHALGVIACPFLLLLLLRYVHNPVGVFACSLYVFSMLAMFLGSTLYHATSSPRPRALLRRFDHAAIYFLISGTYTPLMLLCVGGGTGAVILSISWLIAVVGITFELAAIRPFKNFSLIMYIISGWLCITIILDLIRILSHLSLCLLVGGGVVYTLGVIFYSSEKIYAHAVWHLFVIGGVLLHYGAFLAFLMGR